MIKEAIDALVALGQRSAETKILHPAPHGGRTFEHKINPTAFGPTLGEVLAPFRPAKLEVSTLTGFIDAIKAGVCGEHTNQVIHVEDYLTVSVKSALCDEYGVRDTLLLAKHQPLEAFQFDTYYGDPQKFIIAFQVAFHVNDPDGVYLIRLASNLNAFSSVHTADDGINQTAIFKTGEIKTAERELKPRVKLLPRRTFDEAAPVETEFLVRLKQTDGQPPAIALFAVDGNKWKGESMRSIKTYLTSELTDWTILA